MSKPVPPGENIPACSTSGSRPAGFFALAIAVSTDIPVAMQLVLPRGDLRGGQDLRVCRRVRATGRAVGKIDAPDDQELVGVVRQLSGGPGGLSAIIFSLVSVPVAVGQNRSGSLLPLKVDACLDDAVVAHHYQDERRTHRGLRPAFPA